MKTKLKFTRMTKNNDSMFETFLLGLGQKGIELTLMGVNFETSRNTSPLVLFRVIISYLIKLWDRLQIKMLFINNQENPEVFTAIICCVKLSGLFVLSPVLGG
ncbi:hypothetical protein RF11_06149 [Thelohanellus kitauei]|uniref:Uncharacterized protein n=1 Tax=Thelohanellus kitauei TaxID=669202 RepID=A0A0C2MKM0_THEKT|nr:hypothetical protein RF11_06149 [Thelohanellus kitauei]